jgi:hypothetical protein
MFKRNNKHNTLYRITRHFISAGMNVHITSFFLTVNVPSVVISIDRTAEAWVVDSQWPGD